MGARMAMTAGRRRRQTAKIDCALLVAVLGMFVAGFVHAEATGADAAKSGQAAPPHAAPAKPRAKPAPPSGKGTPRKAGLSTAVTTAPRSRPVMSNAGPAASATAARMQSTQ